ncbi:Rgg/GadR/MutR family transcriptional regulator [Lactococcus petauri]|uniref:Transcriptional regulator n=1 Tax=Lactococcus petauri TaxID=1940789 RepID=A0A252CAB7_9LACT|nr:Rgg/GadR/MutR family transcriptional regulator [Lactococcus petauri]OUK02198.1 hypothetical protein BZZ03_11455 [Lactococcus petauri]
MNNKKYGQIFKELRLQKGLPLSAFNELGISKTSLFNFEEGNTMMGFDRVNIALNKLGYSLANYEELLNNYKPHYLEDTVQKMEESWMFHDVISLKQIEKDLIEKGEHMISLVAKGCYSSLSPMDSETITSYIYELTTFNYIDLCIIFLSLEHLSQKDTMYLLEGLLKKQKILFKSSIIRCRITEIILLATYKFIIQDNQLVANYLLNKLDDDFFTAFNRNIKNLILGCYEYRFINRETGETRMNKSLKIIKKIGKKEVYDFYNKKANKIL